MPKKSDLVTSEVTASPLRRSVRIANSPAPPASVSSRRSSTSSVSVETGQAVKITRGRRASLSQELLTTNAIDKRTSALSSGISSAGSIGDISEESSVTDELSPEKVSSRRRSLRNVKAPSTSPKAIKSTPVKNRRPSTEKTLPKRRGSITLESIQESNLLDTPKKRSARSTTASPQLVSTGINPLNAKQDLNTVVEEASNDKDDDTTQHVQEKRPFVKLYSPSLSMELILSKLKSSTVLLDSTAVESTPTDSPIEISSKETTPIESTAISTTDIDTNKNRSTPMKTTLIKNTIDSTSMEISETENTNLTNTSAESTSVKQTSIKSTPVKSSPIKSTSIGITGTESFYLKNASIESTSVKYNPVKSTPIKNTPMKTTPIKNTMDSTSMEISETENTNLTNTSAESTSVKSTPIKSTPIKSTSIEITETESSNLKNASIENISVKCNPIKSTPIKSTPIKNTPMKTTPTKNTIDSTSLEISETENTNLINTSAESTSVKSTPIKSTPIKSTSIEITETESSNLKNASIENISVKCNPIKSTPIKSTPIKNTPMKTTPIKNTIDSTSLEISETENTNLTNISAESTSVKNTSIKSTPIKSTSIEITETESSNLKNASIESTSVKCNPVKSTPIKNTIKNTPMKTTPTKNTIDSTSMEISETENTNLINTSAESTSVKNTSMKSTPIKSTPIKTTPIKTTPIKTTPIKSTPIKNTPIKSTPIKSTPIKSIPIKSTPIKNTPINTTPIKTTVKESTDVENIDDEDYKFMDESNKSDNSLKQIEIEETKLKSKKRISTISVEDNSFSTIPVEDNQKNDDLEEMECEETELKSKDNLISNVPDEDNKNNDSEQVKRKETKLKSEDNCSVFTEDNNDDYLKRNSTTSPTNEHEYTKLLSKDNSLINEVIEDSDNSDNDLESKMNTSARNESRDIKLLSKDTSFGKVLLTTIDNNNSRKVNESSDILNNSSICDSNDERNEISHDNEESADISSDGNKENILEISVCHNDTVEKNNPVPLNNIIETVEKVSKVDYKEDLKSISPRKSSIKGFSTSTLSSLIVCSKGDNNNKAKKVIDDEIIVSINNDNITNKLDLSLKSSTLSKCNESLSNIADNVEFHENSNSLCTVISDSLEFNDNGNDQENLNNTLESLIQEPEELTKDEDNDRDLENYKTGTEVVDNFLLEDRESTFNEKNIKEADSSDNRTSFETSKTGVNKSLNGNLDDLIRSKSAVFNDDSSNYSSSDEVFAKNEYIDDMAEEGEEDTPSEGSNDIVEKGESLHSTDCELDTTSEYENDSFIDDECQEQLLSENEEEIVEQKTKKRKRIIKPADEMEDDDSVDEECENILSENESGNNTVQKDSKRKRIIKPADEMEDDVLLDGECQEDILPRNESDITEQKTSKRKKIMKPADEMEDDDLVDEECQEDILSENESDSNADQINSKRKMTFKTGDNKEDNIQSVNETQSVCKGKKVVEENINTKKDSLNETSNDNKGSLDASIVSNTKQHRRKSSVSIHENIDVKQFDNCTVANKINNIVELFCSSIDDSKGNVTLNVSIDYEQSSSNDGLTNESFSSHNKNKEKRLDDLEAPSGKVSSKKSKNITKTESPNVVRKRKYEDMDGNLKTNLTACDNIDSVITSSKIKILQNIHLDDRRCEDEETENVVTEKKHKKDKLKSKDRSMNFSIAQKQSSQDLVPSTKVKIQTRKQKDIIVHHLKNASKEAVSKKLNTLKKRKFNDMRMKSKLNPSLNNTSQLWEAESVQTRKVTPSKKNKSNIKLTGDQNISQTVNKTIKSFKSSLKNRKVF